MIEVYAVVDHPGPPLPSEEPLREVASGELALVCAPAGELAATPEALWHHERVVEALMEQRDLLPVRYGTRVADEQEAARSLAEKSSELARMLDGVRGAVELSVRVLGDGEDAAPAEPQSGAEYMRGKSRAAVVHGPLELLARASAQRRPSGATELMRAAYLVERERVPQFVAKVSELQNQHPQLKLLCTGPWPPYSFSGS